MAKKGNVLAAREVLDRTIGKSASEQEHLGKDNPGNVLVVGLFNQEAFFGRVL